MYLLGLSNAIQSNNIVFSIGSSYDKNLTDNLIYTDFESESVFGKIILVHSELKNVSTSY